MMDNRRKEIRPKNCATTLDQIESSAGFVEEDRITEKLSIGMPTQSRLHPPSLTSYAGQRIRLLLRDGSVIIGLMQKRLWNYAHLSNVEEIGKDYRLAADWCDIELGTIARVYPANAKVEKISKV
jgi:hypothetical protein